MGKIGLENHYCLLGFLLECFFIFNFKNSCRLIQIKEDCLFCQGKIKSLREPHADIFVIFKHLKLFELFSYMQQYF